ncbi:MAG: restriction endonuclease [SAR324 cluster bacterium]|uniref:Restriction endonuclease n=1 Tax=SAR324 cluster bacterium TaxID=2024889 RepID=A0A7X9IK92_9DELT|nr:restriction endonuclease [SAR324 cluster bacterium]
MTIPNYQEFMLPLLQLTADKEEHSMKACYEKVAANLQLGEGDLKEVLPSGRSVFRNRVGWACTYLRKAGLLESTKFGSFRITNRGLEVLSRRPAKINTELLRGFPEFTEFLKRSDNTNEDEESLVKPDDRTPEELLNQSYQALRQNLAQELLQKVKECSPAFFEKLVVELLVNMGYGGSRKDAGEAIGKSGDEGIDGIIKEDRLGLDTIYIQAKRWENVVSRPEIQKFAGALQGQRARKGIFITTSAFSGEARDYANKIDSKIILIDGENLAQLMIDFGVGTAIVSTYEIRRVDADYFIEE